MIETSSEAKIYWRHIGVRIYTGTEARHDDGRVAHFAFDQRSLGLFKADQLREQAEEIEQRTS